MTAEALVHVGWYCWRCQAINTMACRSDCVPVHVPAEWADEMRAEIAKRDEEDEPAALTSGQEPPRTPHSGPEAAGTGETAAETLNGPQAGADGHDGPGVEECAAADPVWPLQKAGE